jgi:hypothetical protein
MGLILTMQSTLAIEPRGNRTNFVGSKARLQVLQPEGDGVMLASHRGEMQEFSVRYNSHDLFDGDDKDVVAAADGDSAQVSRQFAKVNLSGYHLQPLCFRRTKVRLFQSLVRTLQR